MQIRLDDIVSYLELINLKYDIIGARDNMILEVASMFHPVKNGFYYWTGSDLPLVETTAVILVDQTFMITEINFTYIVTEKHPQELFYRILDFYFKQRSKGTISKQSFLGDSVELGTNVQIDSYSELENCIIGDNVIVESFCKIYSGTAIGANSVISSGSIVGAQGVAWIWSDDLSERIIQPQLGGVSIGKDCFIGAQTVIVRGSLSENTCIGDHAIMAPGGRIGHGTMIGEYVHFANNVITGGNSAIGNYCFLGSGAVLRPKVSICDHTIVGAGAVVVKNQEVEGMTLMGVPAKPHKTKESPSGMPKPRKV